MANSSDNHSLIRRLASLPEAARAKILASLTEEQLDAVLSSWRFTARPDQLPPDSKFLVHVALGGRGSGKSRAECEWAHERILDFHSIVESSGKNELHRIGAAARTNHDIRETLVEGESGLLAVAEERGIRAVYQPSKKRIEYPDHHARIALFSAEEPDSARGPQYHTIIGDEFAAWNFSITDDAGNNLWTNLLLGLRLKWPDPSFSPQAFLATTPKRIPILRDMVKKGNDPDNADYSLSAMTTLDNAENLDPAYIDTIIAQYEGTNLYRQEVLGLLLDDDELALWNEETITRSHRFINTPADVPEYGKIVIGVDPSGGLSRDHCGIVAVALLESPLPGHRHRCAAVIADRSMQGSPNQWGRRIVELARELGTPHVYAEQNQGYEMVRSVIANEDDTGYCRVELVNASDGKDIRAEPVAQLYEQGRVVHVTRFPFLEDEMVMFTKDGKSSPDRMDALVHGITAILPQIHNRPAQLSTHTSIAIDRSNRAAASSLAAFGRGDRGPTSVYGSPLRRPVPGRGSVLGHR